MEEALKSIIKETYMNVCEEGCCTYKKIGDKEINSITENIIENDDFWSMLDSLIMDELSNYEIGG